MFWLVEIPHQGRSSCWVASDADDAACRILAANARNGELSPEMTSEEVISWLGSDLSALLVFSTDDEALAALDDDDEWRRHGGAQAFDALRKKLTDYDLLSD